MFPTSTLSTSTTSVAPPSRSTRADAVRRVRDVLEASGLRWAWQGESGAVDRWLSAADAKDLDLWCEDAGPVTREVLAALDSALGPRLLEATDPRRLRHVVWAAETAAGLAVVDLTVGPLAVGPLRLLDAEWVTVSRHPGPHGPVLSGAASIADLVLRRLLRGGAPTPTRLGEARDAFQDSDSQERARVRRMTTQALGPDASAVLDALDDQSLPADLPAELPDGLPGRARRRLLAATVRRGLPAAARQWRSVLPAGRAAGPVGLRRRGVVVVLVGTDGSGKSTVAAELTQRLQRAGLPTASAYFGMARGNLPGVDLARRLLGVAAAGDGSEGTAVAAVDESRPADGGPGLEHGTIRRLAAWYYAGEYVGRWCTSVAPQLLLGRVVVVDRWIWDLRESPWPGSSACRWLERVVPAPDVVALGDAPAAMIHARKPERSEQDQARQQELFRRILAGRPARCVEVVVDTSGAAVDPCGPLLSAVVAAAHTSRRQDGVRVT